MLPDRFDVQIDCILKVAVELFSVCLTLNSGRYSLCNIVKESEIIPLEVWTATGAGIGLIGALLVGHGAMATAIVDVFNSIGTALLQYVIPGKLFLKIFGTKRLLNSVGATLTVAVGVFAIACGAYVCTTDLKSSRTSAACGETVGVIHQSGGISAEGFNNGARSGACEAGSCALSRRRRTVACGWGEFSFPPTNAFSRRANFPVGQRTKHPEN
jgi:hypothetical protein